MTEAAFQQHILDRARAAGWRCYHTHDSRRSEPGFPDLVCVHDGRLVAAELKAARGRVTEEQAEWLAALGRVEGCEAYLWRPADQPEIEEVLGIDLAAPVPREEAPSVCTEEPEWIRELRSNLLRRGYSERVVEAAIRGEQKRRRDHE